MTGSGAIRHFVVWFERRITLSLIRSAVHGDDK
jgi:hypothetical protein